MPLDGSLSSRLIIGGIVFIALGMGVAMLFGIGWLLETLDRRQPAARHSAAGASSMGLDLPLRAGRRPRPAATDRGSLLTGGGRHWPAASVPAGSAHARAAPLDWLAACDGALALRLRGRQRIGKSTILHEVATRRARRGGRVLVGDTDARPGMWPACEVYGLGGKFAEIEQMLQHVAGVYAERQRERGRGARSFPALALVVPDLGAVMLQCPSARPLLESLLTKGGKTGIAVLVDCQSDQVGLLNLSGAGTILKLFDQVLDVEYIDGRFDPGRNGYTGGRRVVRWGGAVYDVPALPDPEYLADRYVATHGLAVAPLSVASAPAESPSPSPSPVLTADHVRAALLLQADPQLGDRALARALWPDATAKHGGGGSYAVNAKQLRAEVGPFLSSVTTSGVTAVTAATNGADPAVGTDNAPSAPKVPSA